MKHGYRRIAMIFAGFLAGCGGGGGGGGGTPPNNPPTMAAQSFAATEDAAFSGIVVAADPGDTLTFSVTTQPTKGSLTSFSANGAFTYQPDANFSGADTFTARVADASGQAVTATMTLNVAGVNDAPSAIEDRLTTTSAAGLDVLSNDTDLDGDALTVSLIGTSFPAGATVDASGRVSVPVPAGFKGLVKFRYRVTDSGGATSEADAVAYVNVAPFKLVFIGRPAGTAVTANRVYVNDFLHVYPVDDDPGTVIGLRVSADGHAAAYRAVTSTAQRVMYLRLEQPGVVHDASGEVALGTELDSMILTRDGFNLVYAAGDAAGTAIYRYDYGSPGTAAARISPPSTELQFVAAPRFNATYTAVYYGGRAPANGPSAGYRTQLASGATTRVSPLNAGGQYGVGVDFIWPLPDESKVITHFLEDGPIPNNPHFLVFVNSTLTPDLAALLHISPPAAIVHDIPLVSPDGLHVVHSIYREFSLARTDTPFAETWLNGLPLTQQGVTNIPDRERVMRADSQAALLVGGCGNQVNWPGVPCNVYELPFADPANPVRVHPDNPPGTDSVDPAYSADGARIVFRQSTSGAVTRLVSTRRGAFDAQQVLSPAAESVRNYVLDPSGYVASYALEASGFEGENLALSNVDVPGESLDVGIVSEGLDHFLVPY